MARTRQGLSSLLSRVPFLPEQRFETLLHVPDCFAAANNPERDYLPGALCQLMQLIVAVDPTEPLETRSLIETMCPRLFTPALDHERPCAVPPH